MVVDRVGRRPSGERLATVADAPREAFATHLASYHDAEARFAPAELSALLAMATPMRAEAGHVLTHQYAPAATLYFLVEGCVRFAIQVEQQHEDLEVGTSSTPWTPIGWSGFRSPGRYATTVVCVGPCRLLRLDHQALSAYMRKHPAVGTLLLEAVLEGSYELLATIRGRLSRVVQVPANFAHSLNPDGEEEAYNRAPPPLRDLFRRSPFFEVFDETQLRRLATGAESRYFCRGEPVLAQGATDPGVWVLATGRVALNHRLPESQSEVVLRTLSVPGTVVAWAGCAGIASHPTTVVATRDCTVYRLDPTLLDITRTDGPSLTQALVRRLLWLVSSDLRDARAILISSQFEQEIIAIRNLLEQSCTQLSVSSPLHRLPHLLQSAYTLRDAFDCLEQMSRSDDSLERSLAQLCVDILGEVRREHEMFEALRRVYQAVVTAPAELSPGAVRRLCARGFREAFTLVRYVVQGEEHLPSSPGHIFIFNHLKNHEYNTLPNNFQLTLDSHFVSSVILDPRYGDAGIRVVRKSRGTEYGHQRYYDRLGHISVYTRESDELDEETPAQRRARQTEFFERAGAHLKAGTNIIVSPEGTSYWTEDSPGPFKPGAFRLAASVVPEPLIVPIAVANFDRRVHSTVYAAVIKRPFHLSSVLSDPQDPDAMQRFLDDYRRVYVGYVAEARALALATAREPTRGHEPYTQIRAVSPANAD